MIIVRIWEGLGNQLFQYAYAWSLQQRMNVPVYLDVGHHNRGDFPFEKEDIVKRKLQIQHFNISLKRIDIKKIPALTCLKNKNVIDKIGYLLLKSNFYKWRVIDDNEIMLDICADIMVPDDYTYMNVHCINKGYYKDCRDALLQELQLKKELKLSENLRTILADRNTVSLHIRLTDYLTNPRVLCRQRYYDKAIQYIKDNICNPYFIIFTDDITMAKAKYKFGENVYWISEDSYADYEELIIMSKCQHNIMAQSTFSYWGAWLNQNEEKIVVAPQQWVGRGLYEKGWKVL